ncbi:MAG: DUF4838 domain-containing protein [Bryobacterales bacterium]|nr:DUF4838 domain-containing protein [Bryobacterales bacterium]
MRLLILLALFTISLAAVPLAKQGQSDYTILISSDAIPSERRAADELQRFLEEMSGARLPIRTDGDAVSGPLILLGDSAALRRLKPGIGFDALGAEGFVLRTAGRHLIIAGGRPRGTLYGVYTFLDKLGCRWFTREVSRIPKRPSIETGAFQEVHTPAFENREPFFTEAWDKDWAARNRTNGDHTHLDESTGGKLKYYPFVHSFYELLPPAKYFAEHPEYYSLIDGKRRHERGQLCLTNPEVLRIATAQVEQWIKEKPDTTIFSVSQNDWEGWCECGKCRRVEQEEGGEHSGPVLRFVNALAGEVGRQYTGKLIDTLAYWYTENPPLKVRPAPNVRVRLCPIGICVSHSFLQCPRSAYFRKNLEAWSKITNQLYIWHYNTNFSHYLLPFPDFDELASDVPVYKKHGVVGLFMQGAYAPGGGGEQSELRAYVLARQLWDPSIHVGKTVDEFLDGVYGPAAKPLREYYDLLHAEVRGPAGKHLWIFNIPDYSEAFLPRATELFKRAESLAADAAAKRRVRKARLPVDYYQLLRDSRYIVSDGFYTPARMDELKERALHLIAEMRSHGIESIHEGQPLERDEKTWKEARSLRAYPLENSAWRLDVVPELNGRIVRMIDKSSGSDVLRQFPPGESGYPNNGGILATLHADYHARAMDVTWSAEQSNPQSLTLHGRAQNLAILRTITLDGNTLRTETSVSNASASSVPVALQVRTELSPGNIDAASYSFPRTSGATLTRTMMEAGEQPAGREDWQSPDLPAGLLTLHPSPGPAFSTRFQSSQVLRGYISWTAKSRGGVTLGLWSAEKPLAPGETMTIVATYGKPSSR